MNLSVYFVTPDGVDDAIVLAAVRGGVGVGAELDLDEDADVDDDDRRADRGDRARELEK